MDTLILALMAFSFERVFGYPNVLVHHLGHPVMIMGRLITIFETRTNCLQWGFRLRQALGAFTLLVLILGLGAGAYFLGQLLDQGGLWGLGVEAVIASTLLASRSLQAHVAAVDTALNSEGVEAGRHAVSMIVGRNTDQMERPAIQRAALESLAENHSDGVIAPLFWLAIFGLPGIVIYKLVNTADSMIGHRTDRYEAYGWAAARLDDGLNFIPARITALFLALTSPDPEAALNCVRRDASKHRSPNAGWPEAAMAGGLGLRLSGPRTYNGQTSEQPWINPHGSDPGPDAIAQGLIVTGRANTLSLLILAGLCLGIWATSPSM